MIVLCIYVFILFDRRVGGNVAYTAGMEWKEKLDQGSIRHERAQSQASRKSHKWRRGESICNAASLYSERLNDTPPNGGREGGRERKKRKNGNPINNGTDGQ